MNSSGIHATYKGKNVILEVTRYSLLIKDYKPANTEDITPLICDPHKDSLYYIPLKNIKSLHVKNSETYLLKLKLPADDFVLQFESHHTRDICKSLLLTYIKPEKEVLDRILDTDVETKELFNSVKGIISPADFWTLNKHKLVSLCEMASQSSYKELSMDTKDFVEMLSPPLLEIFSEMNCSITQFYNFLNQSYFCNIRNKQNCIDRMLSEKIRHFNVKQDFATRINNYSLLSMYNKDETPSDTKVVTNKIVDFEPIYPYENKEVEELPTTRLETELKCDIPLLESTEAETSIFESKDLACIRDLSKIAYKAIRENNSKVVGEARKATLKLCDEIAKKYGKGSLIYLKRITPLYFISMNEKSQTSRDLE